MASRECPTCCEEYDSREHRIRILICGHSQCTTCMKAQFFNGQITCAECRAIHRYSDFSNIPVCYVAEKIWEDMDKNKNQDNLHGEKDSHPQAPMFHMGVCVEHGTIKLFWCNTHQEWICTHCSVIEHPRGICDILPIRKKLESEKHVVESNISKELMCLDNTKKEFEKSIFGVKKETEKEKFQIKKIKDEMEKMKISISQKEKEIAVLNAQKSKLEAISKECTEKRSTLDNITTRLHDVRDFKELDTESGKSISMINRYEIWRKVITEKHKISVPKDTKLLEIFGKLKKETNTQQKDTIIQEAKKILQENIKRSKMYATKNIGNVTRYSLIEQKDGCILLNDLQMNLCPDSNAIILEFDDVMALIPKQPVVFLTLNHQGTTLCQLHISLNGPERSVQHFVDLSTGCNDCGGYKTTSFDRVIDKGKPQERIICEGYTNTAGQLKKSALYQTESGAGLIHPVIEGYVYCAGTSSALFGICTISDAKRVSWVPIGHVISGLTELKAGIGKYEANQIVVSKCGVIIESSV